MEREGERFGDRGRKIWRGRVKDLEREGERFEREGERFGERGEND